jgi:hypothetical protein
VQEIVRLYIVILKYFLKKNALIILNVRKSVTFTYCPGKEDTDLRTFNTTKYRGEGVSLRDKFIIYL